MANLRITPRNFHDEATVTVSTAATGFPVTNTNNCIRSRTWRSTSTATATISGTFSTGYYYRGNSLALFQHNGHGGFVRLELFNDTAWTSVNYDTGTINLSNVSDPSTSYEWGLIGLGIDYNPFKALDPYWLYFQQSIFKSYRITLSGLVSPRTYWEVGRVFLGKHFTAGINPAYGAALGMSDLTDSNRSRGGSLRTNVGASWKTAAFDLNWMSEDDAISWLDIMRYCGTGRDFVISMFPEEVTRRERNNTFNAKFQSLDPIGRQVSYLTKRFQVVEV